MNTGIAGGMIEVIRSERQRRLDRLRDEDPDIAYDHWLFTDEPFINEMCLMMLVALHHQAEREIICLSARKSAGSTTSREQYRQHTEKQEKLFKKHGLLHLVGILGLPLSPDREKHMTTLRLLANCCKHHPGREPKRALLEHLNLPLVPAGDLVVAYLPLAESQAFKEGFAVSINLPKVADYCRVADRFVDLIDELLEDARCANPQLAMVRISLAEFGA